MKSRRFLNWILHPATLSLAGPILCAASTIVPPGLVAGDQFRLVFVTSTSTLSNSADISYYNNFVTVAANSPGSAVAFLGASWFAIASTPSISAADNIGGASPVAIYNLNPAGDQLVANGAGWSLGSLWGGIIYHPILYDDRGLPSSSFTWTGTLILGGTAMPLSIQYATNGDPTAFLSAWIENDNGDTSEALPLYAISPVLVVTPGGGAAVATPEPGTLSLLFIGALLALGRATLTAFSKSGVGVRTRTSNEVLTGTEKQ